MTESPSTRNIQASLPACALFAAVLAAAPLALCMPLNSDTALFDVQAAEVLKGGVMYRDIVEPNLPGVVWIHLLIRSVAGWSSEAMQAIDLCLFAASVYLLSRLLEQQRLLFAFLAGLFYSSCNEWVHCQRDIWMLLPAAGAVLVNVLRLKRSSGGLAVVEGTLWGIAFWIKPHIAIPAVSVLGMHAFLRSSWRAALKETLLVLTGGVLAGIPGVIWLIHSGAWPHFLEMMLEWNPEYLAAGRARQSFSRWQLMFRRFFPWWFIHLTAIPGVCLWMKRLSNRMCCHRQTCLLIAFYVGWLIQSLSLQHAMDYIHAPALLLGLLTLFRIRQSWPTPAAERATTQMNLMPPLVCATVFLVVISSPFFRVSHITQWSECVRNGSTAEVRAQLAHGNFPDWKHLQNVEDWLAAQNVSDRQLTCFNIHSVHLFRELGVQPATRYWAVGILQELFPRRADSIAGEVRDSGTRFVVTEERESKHNSDTLPEGFPWDLPVVFRSGSYRVHEMRTAVAEHEGQIQHGE